MFAHLARRGRGPLALPLCLVMATLPGCGASRPAAPESWGGEVAATGREPRPAKAGRKTAKDEDAALSGREKRALLKARKSG